MDYRNFKYICLNTNSLQGTNRLIVIGLHRITLDLLDGANGGLYCSQECPKLV